MKFGFRLRLAITIVMVAFSCVIAVLAVNYYDAKELIEANYIKTLDDKITIQTERLDGIMQEMYLESRRMAYSEELHRQITQYQTSAKGYTDGILLSQKLDELLDFRQLDAAVYLYLPQYRCVFSSLAYNTVRELPDGAIPEWVVAAENPFQPLYFTNRFARTSQHVFAYTHVVQDGDGNTIGMLCITVDERQLYYELLSPLMITEQETYCLLAPDGTICSARDVGEIGKQAVTSAGYDDRMNAQIAENDALCISVQAPFTGYRLQCLSDLAGLTAALRTRLIYMGIAGAILSVLLICVACKASERLSRPIDELVRAMDQVGGGDFSARAHIQTEDEFETLREHFNSMVSRMDTLMEQLVQEHTQKKQAELNALQYQIRPHFMYNTLNSIRFAARLQKNYKLAELIGSFTALLEASVQRKGAFLPLSDEIQLVRDYLSLQAFRYFNCFETIYKLAPETQGCFVPCLLLQPMVENAVFHGVDTKRNDNVIEISAWIERDTLYLSIRDNGKGMETSGVLDTAQESRRLTGIGLQNVAQRLALYYGEAAGFRIDSHPGVGTTVLFYLPVSHDPDEYTV
ncbi:histidine kinase [Butyricicoccus pullicaecorum]|uniref:histidine kinase n=1 Tax=Butyricicoccus pullicaecorum 1.2 TaxID=1203606 RepID=R8W5U6_9FIRM|nr:histidine kinase [Butyricicoccus pullicaecorum]EOQ40069.1 hypothetical protein HMPREF1526_00767 [Butyricicoccus pullicaecorum 1.2]SKA68397.1 two-component system, sensor histidine kinase YesM [Butyricicoccus pullicaecorum DSM 23266]